MKKVFMVLIAAALIAGCANREARIDKRTKRLASETAFVMGVDPSAVQISNVSGNASGYRWRANVNGASYNCSMFGGNFLSWGASTPPECFPVAGSGKTTKTSGKAKNKSCNALLKAAGRCK